MPLQRAVVDFGAEHAFGQVPDKLREHYGISLSPSTIRRLTERHAQGIHAAEGVADAYPPEAGCAYVVAEVDGSMIPIVEVDEAAPDKRKGKTQGWQEVRLCLAHELGTVTPRFGAVFQGSVAQAGQHLFDCACQVGLGRETYVHAVGDGACWIADQVEQWFGPQGHYLIDFYHACSYLGAAAGSCAGERAPAAWLEEHKVLLKAGQVQTLLDRLEPHLEPAEADDPQAPVRACYRYLSNRVGQLDYPSALSKGLPIGSGEIESAHRYVIQARLKLPGAWWKADNAQHMLTLRVLRANQEWEDYWQNLAMAA